MIIGIGTDIIEIARIEKAIRSPSFLRRVYTDREQSVFDKKPSKLAGNFAIKEAMAKALGTGFHGFEPRDIEVLRNDVGKPEVSLYRGALTLFHKAGVRDIHISISNTKEFAIGYVILEK